MTTWASPCEANACIEVAEIGDGIIGIRTTGRPETVVQATYEEWVAFRNGICAGKFDYIGRRYDLEFATVPPYVATLRPRTPVRTAESAQDGPTGPGEDTDGGPANPDGLSPTENAIDRALRADSDRWERRFTPTPGQPGGIIIPIPATETPT